MNDEDVVEVLDSYELESIIRLILSVLFLCILVFAFLLYLSLGQYVYTIIVAVLIGLDLWAIKAWTRKLSKIGSAKKKVRDVSLT
jgi:hypothetical protein